MAYDKEAVEKEILDAIEKNFITFFDDITLFVEPSRKTLYDWKLHESDTIKEAIRRNKLEIKRQMRQRWQKHDSPVLQIAAYKLIAEDEEIAKITMNKVELSGKDGAAIQTENKHVVEFRKMNNSTPENS